MKKYVITGGPGTGKTTVIDELHKRGYAVVVEVPRMLIEEKKRLNADYSPLDNPQLFQKEFIDLQIALESEAASAVTFFDRGVVDNYGYSLYYKMPIPEVLEKSGRGRYDTVFLLDPLPSYNTDGSRFEDKETALAIHNAIKDGYEKLGYKLINVPVLPLKERVDYIVEQLAL